MKTFNRFNPAFIIVIIFVVILAVSAGWVIAQSVSQAPAPNAQGATPNSQQSVPVPKQTPKYFGTVGRPDPFITVQAGAPAAGAAMAIPGQAQAEPGASAGPVLTGIFFINGSRYAIIRSGGTNFIVKEGTEKFGFKITRITEKKVVLQNKEGKSELILGDYIFSRTQAIQPQSIPGKLPQDQTLIPPPMQAPVPTDGIPVQTQQIPTEPGGAQPAQQPR